jgi:hypothetical protein
VKVAPHQTLNTKHKTPNTELTNKIAANLFPQMKKNFLAALQPPLSKYHTKNLVGERKGFLREGRDCRKWNIFGLKFFDIYSFAQIARSPP